MERQRTSRVDKCCSARGRHRSGHGLCLQTSTNPINLSSEMQHLVQLQTKISTCKVIFQAKYVTRVRYVYFANNSSGISKSTKVKRTKFICGRVNGWGEGSKAKENIVSSPDRGKRGLDSHASVPPKKLAYKNLPGKAKACGPDPRHTSQPPLDMRNGGPH